MWLLDGREVHLGDEEELPRQRRMEQSEIEAFLGPPPAQRPREWMDTGFEADFVPESPGGVTEFGLTDFERWPPVAGRGMGQDSGSEGPRQPRRASGEVDSLQAGSPLSPRLPRDHVRRSFRDPRLPRDHLRRSSRDSPRRMTRDSPRRSPGASPHRPSPRSPSAPLPVVIVPPITIEAEPIATPVPTLTLTRSELSHGAIVGIRRVIRAHVGQTMAQSALVRQINSKFRPGNEVWRRTLSRLEECGAVRFEGGGGRRQTMRLVSWEVVTDANIFGEQ